MKKFNTFVGWQLRLGALTAIAIAVVGIVLYALQGHGVAPEVSTFSERVVTYPSFVALWAGLCAGEATAVMQLAVAVLVATPLLRIVCSLVGFALERDWLYVGITLLVACIVGSTIVLKL